MKNALKYKSYTGIVEFSAEDGVFFGKLFGINDLVTFEGTSVKELEKAFREAVDDYIETCEAMGKPAERNFKGSFNIRINPHVHREAAFKARSMHISLNEFVEQAIAKAVQLPLVAEDSYTLYQKVSGSKKAAPKAKRKEPVKGPSKKTIQSKVKNQ